MATGNLPFGAAEILALRKAGKRPADMVLASLIGPLRGENNPVVIAKPGRSYDWRFLTGLDCLVVSDSRQPRDAVRAIIDALKALPTSYLGLWLADRQNGVNFIVGGVTARPRGLLRHMDAIDRLHLSSIGQAHERGLLCA